MKALEHYNPGMKFAPNRQSSKTMLKRPEWLGRVSIPRPIKLFSRGSGRIETRFLKDKTTIKV